ncbi:hypothetical protein TL16_g11941 [Triparma laevis f. inornata]|uniref:CAP-Gly domain-containing protein n=1 Tax=Triparma laevis f. inornata TaxID=1714386 RepID=A0A9W7BIE4_9STRA|nr:hypothetical protein TL16_g11941 [Triparma laevis f. inornata]
MDLHTACEVQLKDQLVQGVVMFGPSGVEFAAGDDWIGIRLTTGSLGLGKNDGSVNGKKYFEAGADKNGIFVRATQVKPRENMSRLDELKLKREIAAFTGGERRTSTSSIATTGGTSRLDALRAKRASLTQKKDGTMIAKLKKSLQDSKDENEALKFVAEKQKEKISSFKQERESLESEIRETTRRTSLTPQKGDTITPSKVPNAVRRMSMNNGVSKEVHAQVGTQLEEMSAKYEDADKQVKWYQHELEKAQNLLESRITECDEIVKSNEELKLSRKELSVKDSKTSASLTATVNSLTRKNQELEAAVEDNSTRLEMMTVDFETVKEEKETLEEKVEELTLDYETAMMEVEELKEEMETNIMEDEGGDTDEAQLKTENKRLREGLMRLRESSSATQNDLTKKLRQAEKQAESTGQHEKELKDLRNHKRKSVVEIGELKDFVDSARSYEEMVEEMSSKNLQLEDDVKQLTDKITDLEEEVEMAAEMEEVQAEELSAAMEDIQGNDIVVANLQEAIRLQREKEDEHDETVKRYKKLVTDLKREKDTLVSHMKDTEGDQADQIEKSQQVLAKAAREAKMMEELKQKEHATKKLRMQQPVSKFQIATFESFLPTEVCDKFVSALKADVTLQTVCGASALGLEDLFEMWATEQDEEVSVDTQTALRACEGNCMLGECFVNAAMASYRVMLALGMGGVEGEIRGSIDSVQASVMVGGYFKRIEEHAINLVEKRASDGFISAEDAVLIDFDKEIKLAVQAIQGDSVMPLIPADWNPQGIDQVRDVYTAACLSCSTHYRLASFFTPEIAGKLKTLSLESKKLAQAIDEQVLLGVEDTGEYVSAVKALVASILDNFDSDDWSQITASLDAAHTSVAKCLKSARTGATGITALAPTSLTSFESSCKYLEEMKIGENVWTRRGSVLQQQFLRGAEAEKKLADIGTNFESTRSELEGKEREIAILTKKISQFEDMLAEGPGKVEEEEKEIEDDSEKFVAMKNENAMLHEAMEVLHAQVEEYESELKYMKGGKAGKGKSPMRMSSRAGSMASRSDSVVSR